MVDNVDYRGMEHYLDVGILLITDLLDSNCEVPQTPLVLFPQSLEHSRTLNTQSGLESQQRFQKQIMLDIRGSCCQMMVEAADTSLLAHLGSVHILQLMVAPGRMLTGEIACTDFGGDPNPKYLVHQGLDLRFRQQNPIMETV